MPYVESPFGTDGQKDADVVAALFLLMLMRQH